MQAALLERFRKYSTQHQRGHGSCAVCALPDDVYDTVMHLRSEGLAPAAAIQAWMIEDLKFAGKRLESIATGRPLAPTRDAFRRHVERHHVRKPLGVNVLPNGATEPVTTTSRSGAARKRRT